MSLRPRLLTAALILIGATAPIHAQESSFPEVCRSGTPATAEGQHDAMNHAMTKDHQVASMAGMKKMDSDMMQGMMKEDADVAFICGMIAHHQGAIDMANVELQMGDNEAAKQMATKIIEAQTTEIAEMTVWLKDNAQ